MSLGHKRARIGVNEAYVATISIDGSYTTNATGVAWSGDTLVNNLALLRGNNPNDTFVVVPED